MTGQGKAGWGDIGECLGCLGMFPEVEDVEIIADLFQMIVIKLGHSSMNHQIHTLFFSEDVFCALGLEMQRSMFVPQMWQPMRWCCSLLVAIGYRLVLDRGMLREYEQGFCFEG